MLYDAGCRHSNNASAAPSFRAALPFIGGMGARSLSHSPPGRRPRAAGLRAARRGAAPERAQRLRRLRWHQGQPGIRRVPAAARREARCARCSRAPSSPTTSMPTTPSPSAAILDGYSPATRIGRSPLFQAARSSGSAVRTSRSRSSSSSASARRAIRASTSPSSAPPSPARAFQTGRTCRTPWTRSSRKPPRRFINDVTRNRFDIPQKDRLRLRDLRLVRRATSTSRGGLIARLPRALRAGTGHARRADGRTPRDHVTCPMTGT